MILQDGKKNFFVLFAFFYRSLEQKLNDTQVILDL
jgi:hypothetical protein